MLRQFTDNLPNNAEDKAVRIERKEATDITANAVVLDPKTKLSQLKNDNHEVDPTLGESVTSTTMFSESFSESTDYQTSSESFDISSCVIIKEAPMHPSSSQAKPKKKRNPGKPRHASSGAVDRVKRSGAEGQAKITTDTTCKDTHESPQSTEGREIRIPLRPFAFAGQRESHKSAADQTSRSDYSKQAQTSAGRARSPLSKNEKVGHCTSECKIEIFDSKDNTFCGVGPKQSSERNLEPTQQSAKRNVVRRQLSDRNLHPRRLSFDRSRNDLSRQLSERQVQGRQCDQKLASKQLSERRLASKQLSERSAGFRQSLFDRDVNIILRQSSERLFTSFHGGSKKQLSERNILKRHSSHRKLAQRQASEKALLSRSTSERKCVTKQFSNKVVLSSSTSQSKCVVRQESSERNALSRRLSDTHGVSDRQQQTLTTLFSGDKQSAAHTSQLAPLMLSSEVINKSKESSEAKCRSESLSENFPGSKEQVGQKSGSKPNLKGGAEPIISSKVELEQSKGSVQVAGKKIRPKLTSQRTERNLRRAGGVERAEQQPEQQLSPYGEGQASFADLNELVAADLEFEACVETTGGDSTFDAYLQFTLSPVAKKPTVGAPRDISTPEKILSELRILPGSPPIPMKSAKQQKKSDCLPPSSSPLVGSKTNNSTRRQSFPVRRGGSPRRDISTRRGSFHSFKDEK